MDLGLCSKNKKADKDTERIKVHLLILGISLQVVVIWYKSFFDCVFSSMFLTPRICNPLQCSCLENPRDGGAWWAALYGLAQSQTRLKRLSSSSTCKIHWDFGVHSILSAYFTCSAEAFIWAECMYFRPLECCFTNDCKILSSSWRN